MKELLQSKGFSLNTYPEGKFWELTVEDDENLKGKICKILVLVNKCVGTTYKGRYFSVHYCQKQAYQHKC